MQTQEHFTLKQVAESIRKTIEQRYSRTYWVLAEMHKLNETRKGHCYPELVQKEDGTIVAEMRGTIWKTHFDRISARFMEIVREPLRDGLELLFLVKIVYHPIYNLGLEIIDIDPNYALGALQRERQETLEKLSREGILNANQQLEMALVPKRLAIISQAGSKGYSDFVTLLNGHPKRYRFDTFLFEATLQGDAAIGSISAQLKRIERIKQHFDAVVIIRGGGGEIGMHCYNNYGLARDIATFPLPVLTGIGHSTNMTVCEMIAYNNGITPSDLAYYLLRIFEELDAPLDEAAASLPGLVKNFLRQTNNGFTAELKQFQSVTKRALRERQVEATVAIKDFQRVVRLGLQHESGRLTSSGNMLRPLTAARIAGGRAGLGNFASTVVIHGKGCVRSRQQTLDSAAQRIFQSAPQIFSRSAQQLEQFHQRLRLSDPVRVLERGYSIVTNANGPLGKDNPAKKGEHLLIRSAASVAEATVTEVRGEK
jgi:exodeoxyribonuclease VII large subunit